MPQDILRGWSQQRPGEQRVEPGRLAQPPAGFGTFLQSNDDGTIDIFTGGRKLRVSVSPSIEVDGADCFKKAADFSSTDNR